MPMQKSSVAIFLAVLFLVFPVCGQETDISKMQDNGTGPDGIMILPKGMAMRCGLSSRDGSDPEKINACMDRLVALTQDGAVGKESSYEIMTEILGQMNAVYMQTALAAKAEAGDYEDKMDEETGDSAATTVRDKQAQLVNLSAMGGRNAITLNQVYASLLFLQAMNGFYEYDFSRREVKAEE